MLDTPATERLVARMRSRLERTGVLSGSIVVSNASSEERTAAARLLGRPVRAGSTATVSLDDLDSLLQRTGIWPEGLADAVEVITGEVILPERRDAEREGWQRANALLRQRIGNERLAVWVDSVTRSGALRRAGGDQDGALRLASLLAEIADALPSTGESLGAFAARIIGDAHALDRGTALGPLATVLAGTLGKVESPANGRSARWRRDAWQSVGVIVDELSSMALALGLPGGPDSPTARVLAEYAAVGQPVLLTLRQLSADTIGAVPPHVYVCENPAVVAAAADRWGADCAPLVCVNGQPGGAVMLLLHALIEGGARLRYHGDFDSGGLAIARTLARSVPWDPWRFDRASYVSVASSKYPPIRGMIGDSPWDPELAASMTELGWKVEEEQVLDDLIADLAPRRHAGV